ncbi:MAG: TetR/AcrR family transcriptional regulator [Robiginitomaculum sp.]|nr:TetR/AcrR family transcriptional regulator [Robiginitomaculum sp.]
MPLSTEHKQQTRANIVESARVLFNRHGFEAVTIDMIMKSAGLTRGGFYNHFKNKEALYSEAVSSFLIGRGLKWRKAAGIDPKRPNPEMAQQMLQSYLSPEHLGDLDGQCPMIALSSDVARAKPDVQASYQELLEGMVWLFETSFAQERGEQVNPRDKALTMAALCVGGMILARTLPNSELAEEVRAAANSAALDITSA